MNNPNAIYQQGVPLLPPPPPLPSQQGASRLNQQQYPTQYPAGSPHQPQNISASQSQFLPSQPASQLQHHPSYGTQPSNLIHQPADPAFYAHPSPYSTNSAAGSYTSSDPNEVMAQAAMSRQSQPFPPILQTPQSQSPASMHSPHYDASGRSSYGGYPSMAQPMYYQQTYGMQPAPSYQQQPPASQAYPAAPSTAYASQPPVSQGYSSVPSSTYAQQPPPAQSYPTPAQSYPTPSPAYTPQAATPQSYPAVTTSYQQHASYPQPPPQVPSQPAQTIDPKPAHPQLQRGSFSQPPPPAQVQPPPTPQHVQTSPQAQSQPVMPSMTLQSSTPVSTTGNTSSAAPGPIPATTPLVVRQDQNGVQWIMFEYSRDRVKMEYTIRCDVESVKPEDLSQEFRSDNCVYPRACGAREAYKGNRLAYESECNTVGWALAQLNPSLRGKRGLIQRAVDSWRNSNQDPRLRSRRVRRQAKLNNRKNNIGPSPVPSSSMQAPQTLQPPRPGTTQHHLHGLHTHHGDDPRGAVDDRYDTAPFTPLYYHSEPELVAGPSSFQYEEVYEPPAPDEVVQISEYHSSGMPQVSQAVEPEDVEMVEQAERRQDKGKGKKRVTKGFPPPDIKDDDDEERNLFGNLPRSKRPKFIHVEDALKYGAKTRIRASLDHHAAEDIPDQYRKKHAVFPKTYFPRETAGLQEDEDTPIGPDTWDDVDDETPANLVDLTGDTYMYDHSMQAQKSRKSTRMIRVKGPNDEMIELPIPSLTKSRRRTQVHLNEIGARIAWAQPKLFDERKVMLQQAIDVYRDKVHTAVTKNEGVYEDVSLADMPRHFEVRPGKRKWQESLAKWKTEKAMRALDRAGALSRAMNPWPMMEPMETSWFSMGQPVI